MLLQFTVENYKSFKNPAVLSLEASAEKELPDNVTAIGKDRILNAIAIFGANAAGKSNIFSALKAAVTMVRKSNSRQVLESLNEIVPYRFDASYVSKPSRFEFAFVAEKVKYVYGFSATKKEVVEEYLYAYYSAKASTVFERINGNQYRFTMPSLRRELLPLTERNTSNKLFLATATAWNCKETRPAYVWFEKMINSYSTESNQLFAQTAHLFEDGNNRSLRDFTRWILREADLSIEDYTVKDESDTENKYINQPTEEAHVNMPNSKKISIETIHKIERNGQVFTHKLSLDEESDGTRNIFLFSPILKRAFETGETLCIDEFDASLHPLLVRYLVGLFNNRQVNRSCAQLVISSHSTDLLSLKNLRRDQIYFVEKNRKNGESELYSLDDFSPRLGENVLKAYMSGRYGSVPLIDMEASL